MQGIKYFAVHCLKLYKHAAPYTLHDAARFLSFLIDSINNACIKV